MEFAGRGARPQTVAQKLQTCRVQAGEGATALAGNRAPAREITSLHTFDHFGTRGFTLIRLMVGVGALTLIFSLVLHRRHQRALHSQAGSARDAVNLTAPAAVADPSAANRVSGFAPSGALTPCVVFVVPKFY